jgi:hypothetical protein
VFVIGRFQLLLSLLLPLLLLLLFIRAIGPLAYTDVLQNLQRNVNFGPYFIYMSPTPLTDQVNK